MFDYDDGRSQFYHRPNQLLSIMIGEPSQLTGRKMLWIMFLVMVLQILSSLKTAHQKKIV
jgi:hypothetical protein